MFILEVIPITQLWALDNKTAISIGDHKLKKILRKLKVEQQLSKIEGEEVKGESDDNNITEA